MWGPGAWNWYGTWEWGRDVGLRPLGDIARTLLFGNPILEVGVGDGE